MSNCQCFTLHWCIMKFCHWSDATPNQGDFFPARFAAKGAEGKACTMFLEQLEANAISDKASWAGFVKGLHTLWISLMMIDLYSSKCLFSWFIHTNQVPDLRSYWNGNVCSAEAKADQAKPAADVGNVLWGEKAMDCLKISDSGSHCGRDDL